MFLCVSVYFLINTNTLINRHIMNFLVICVESTMKRRPSTGISTSARGPSAQGQKGTQQQSTALGKLGIGQVDGVTLYHYSFAFLSNYIFCAFSKTSSSTSLVSCSNPSVPSLPFPPPPPPKCNFLPFFLIPVS